MHRHAALSFLIIALSWSWFAQATLCADAIVAGAKREGQVVFYASMEVPSQQRLTAAFEKKYPFIKVAATRIGSERMATRLIAEAQARKVQADVVNQSAFDFYGVLQKGLFDGYLSPERAAFPADYRDDKGLWIINAVTLNVIAYNKKMVPAADVPKTFWDLTEPRWKGQLLMDENESKWMGGMIHYYGEAKAMELMRKLAGQEIQFRTGHSLLHTLLAAGERPIVVVAFANGVDRMKKESAPIEWVTAEPVIGLTFGLGLAKSAPHPNAARLLIDFILSREGQEAMGVSGYYVPRTDVASPILQEAPPKTKVIPLPMTLAPRYNEYFQTFRKVMGLK
ncbi:MAG TPA: extracellular solute-binding protein [Candidatus Acidoferrales bacterium]|nr:extracellular solute-binding protein [Candidatus Acidoferrales bacterium]